MGTSSTSVTFPYAIKTVAIQTCEVMPFNMTNGGTFNSTASFTPFIAGIAMQCFPPMHIYKTVRLHTRFEYTFSNVVPTSAQSIIGISCTNQIPPFPLGEKLPPFQSNPTLIDNFMPLNINAVSNQVNLSLDITSLLTGTSTNVICIWFPPAAGETVRQGGVFDVLNFWKIDLVYQTIGVRDER